MQIILDLCAMKCFKHDTTEAVGVCPWCGRAICAACAAVDGPPGPRLACSDECANALERNEDASGARGANFVHAVINNNGPTTASKHDLPAFKKLLEVSCHFIPVRDRKTGTTGTRH